MATKKTTKGTKRTTKSTKKTSKKASNKKLVVKKPPVAPTELEIAKLTEEMLSGVEDGSTLPTFELMLPPPFVGDTITGHLYLTTHVCPVCEASMETIGSGFPLMMCGQCGVKMRTTRNLVKEDV